MDAYGLREIEMLAVLDTELDSYLEEQEESEDIVYWRNETKYLEQRIMVEMDKYAEVAKAMGVPCGAWFGDPIIPHSQVVIWAETMKEDADKYADLCDS